MLTAVGRWRSRARASLAEMNRQSGSCAMAMGTGARATRSASARSRDRSSSGVASSGGSNNVARPDMVNPTGSIEYIPGSTAILADRAGARPEAKNEPVSARSKPAARRGRRSAALPDSRLSCVARRSVDLDARRVGGPVTAGSGRNPYNPSGSSCRSRPAAESVSITSSSSSARAAWGWCTGPATAGSAVTSR